MQKLAHEIYSFDEFKLDLTRGALFRGVDELKLRPKSFDVLKYFAENSGRLISKDELIEAVWHETAVTDDSLVQCLKDIRNELGDQSQTIIRTVPRRGYIFEKEVSENGVAAYVEETSGVHLVIEETTENGHGDAEKGRRGKGEKGRKGKLLNAVKGRKIAFALALSAFVLIGGGLAYGLFVYFLQPPVSPFKSVSIKRLTTDGKAETVAVSPDGKYIAYATSDGGRQSLWVRQVAAVNNVQIVAPADVEYNGLTFSPDGNFVYYVQGNVLYQTATFGGSTRKLWEGVSTKVTFSPDGKRIAFVRLGAGDGKGSRLVLANSDGTGDEQILAYRNPPEAFAASGCAWSPDGATIICAGGDNALFGNQYPVAVRVADGSQKPLTTKRWNLLGQTAWLADGSGFLMAAWDNLGAGSQLWHVTFPGGVPVRIYNDLNDYFDLSLTANSETLVTIQWQPQLNIQAINLTEEPRQTKQLTFGTNGSDGQGCLTTTPDGKIVYESETSGTGDLWIMDEDGGNQRQLTFDDPKEDGATVSPDGRSVVFDVASQGIWKIGLDGGNRRQLTKYGMFPEYSADGNWIFYTVPHENWSLWKVSSDGGEPIRLSDMPANQPAVSPDGKLIAFIEKRPFRGTKKLKIVPVDGGEPLMVFDITDLSGLFDLDWLPDGSAVAYNAGGNGAQRIVSQPLDGGAPQILLAAKSEAESIHSFAFSRDGKQLFISAGPINQNVVMFSLSR
jgi:Tol biopolymer transport system component/DNA-binding winged helix-turn-helix (wHTH) protein